MPRHCSAGGCKSRDNRETRNAGITFHKLPKGESRRNLWITNSHRTDSWDPHTDFVYFCSKHFTPESFELTGCSGIRRLKEDAFPTVFESFSTNRHRRPGRLQRRDDIPVSKNSPPSGDQENIQEKDQSSEDTTDQRSAAAAEENENIPTSSQEPAEVEQLSQQEQSSPSLPVSHPLSPLRYMRRLPPPPGFYLSKEHSYAQLCPLLWRRRYDQAIDCLEKALRQLHAARRRENRLRSTVLRLRDKRLKQALLASRDGCKNRERWTPGEKRRGKGGWNHEESENDVFEDQMELGGCFLPDTNSWSEEERGCCFYCGRGQGQVQAQLAQRGPKNGKDAQPVLTVHEDSLKAQRGADISACSTAENTKDVRMVRLERSPGKGEDTTPHHTNVSTSEVLIQTPALQHVIPTGVSLTNIHEQSLQFLGSQQRLLLSDTCEGEAEAAGNQNLQQQLFWIQDSTEGQLILVPVPAEDPLQNFIRMEGASDEAQTILVSEVDLNGDMGLVTENSGGLSRAETACDGEHSDQHPVINTTLVEMREDVREKLKEHLEGFHLQLSTEFLT